MLTLTTAYNWKQTFYIGLKEQKHCNATLSKSKNSDNPYLLPLSLLPLPLPPPPPPKKNPPQTQIKKVVPTISKLFHIITCHFKTFQHQHHIINISLISFNTLLWNFTNCHSNSDTDANGPLGTGSSQNLWHNKMACKMSSTWLTILKMANK